MLGIPQLLMVQLLFKLKSQHPSIHINDYHAVLSEYMPRVSKEQVIMTMNRLQARGIVKVDSMKRVTICPDDKAKEDINEAVALMEIALELME